MDLELPIDQRQTDGDEKNEEGWRDFDAGAEKKTRENFWMERLKQLLSHYTLVSEQPSLLRHAAGSPAVLARRRS